MPITPRLRTAVVRCLCLAAVSAPLAAQSTTDRITAADLRQRLYLIADDSMAGRGTGTLGNYQTAEYVAAEFKRLGLKPGGSMAAGFSGCLSTGQCRRVAASASRAAPRRSPPTWKQRRSTPSTAVST